VRRARPPLDPRLGIKVSALIVIVVAAGGLRHCAAETTEERVNRRLSAESVVCSCLYARARSKPGRLATWLRRIFEFHFVCQHRDWITYLFANRFNGYVILSSLRVT